MRTLLLTLLFGALLCGATPARADRFGDIDYRVPAGWQKVEKGGFAILAGPLDASGKPRAAIFVTPGASYQGEFGDWFHSTVIQAESSDTSIRRGGVQRIASNGNYDALTIDTVTSDRQGMAMHRKYIAANPGGKAELFVYMTYDDRTAQQFLPKLREFLGSVRYAQLGGVSNPHTRTAQDRHPPEPASGGRCRIVTRQQCMSEMSGGFGGTMTPTYNCLPVTKTVCN